MLIQLAREKATNETRESIDGRTNTYYDVGRSSDWCCSGSESSRTTDSRLCSPCPWTDHRLDGLETAAMDESLHRTACAKNDEIDSHSSEPRRCCCTLNETNRSERSRGRGHRELTDRLRHGVRGTVGYCHHHHLELGDGKKKNLCEEEKSMLRDVRAFVHCKQRKREEKTSRPTSSRQLCVPCMPSSLHEKIDACSRSERANAGEREREEKKFRASEREREKCSLSRLSFNYTVCSFVLSILFPRAIFHKAMENGTRLAFLARAPPPSL